MTYVLLIQFNNWRYTVEFKANTASDALYQASESEGIPLENITILQSY